MRSLHSLLRMAPPDRRLLMQAAGLTALFRVALWILPFATTQRLARAAAIRPRAAPREAARIAYFMELTRRRLPIGNCLARALAAQVLLTHSGHDADIRIGVAREGGRFQAHAWVESGGVVLVGDDERERYRAATGPGRVA